MWFVQRHTFSQEKTCIASMRRKKKGRCDAATHLFARKNLYREHRKREKGRCDAATHHFKRKNLCREHGEGEKDEPKPHHTAQHDTIIPQNKATPHHITSYHNHIQTRQHYQQTKPHTMPQTPYTTALYNKKLLPRNRRKSFIDLSAN